MTLPEAHSAIALRPYEPRDLEAIVRLDRECFAPSLRFGLAEMRRFAEGPGSIALIAEGSDGVAGFLIVEVHRPEAGIAYVVTVDVAERCAGQGLGRRLLAAGERAAANAGAARMLLHVHVANKRAVALYERGGYVCKRRVPGFYRGVPGGGDAVLYEKAL